MFVHFCDQDSVMTPKISVVIPARMHSTRLPNKPLANICGKPMIQWVYENALKIEGVDNVIVATDHSEIESVVKKFGGRCEMTDPHLKSGTDRVAQVAKKVDSDIYINIQGDEPLLSTHSVERVLAKVLSNQFEIATAMSPFTSAESLADQSKVKVIVDKNERAIYFSRFPIPYSRGDIPSDPKKMICMLHQGIYIYKREALFRFTQLEECDLERAESLEQLRLLNSGIPLGVSKVNDESFGVDTPEDLKKMIMMLSEKTRN